MMDTQPIAFESAADAYILWLSTGAISQSHQRRTSSNIIGEGLQAFTNLAVLLSNAKWGSATVHWLHVF
ncbi:GGGtGRT protein [Vibrio lentus]|nr:GGGtGRT protein [Vibrio lentus]